MKHAVDLLRKVLIVTPHYPPQRLGGTELHARKIAGWLRNHGVSVEIVCVEVVTQGEQDDLAVRQDVYEDVIVHRLYLTEARSPDRFRNTYDHKKIEAYIDRVVDQWQPDLLHLISGYLVTGCAIRSAHRHNRPAVVTVTDYWFVCPRINLIRSNGQPCTGPHNALDCTRCLWGESRRHRLPEQALPAVADLVWKGLSRFDGLINQIPLYNEMGRRQQVLIELLNQADAVTIPTNSLRPRLVRAGASDHFHLSRHGLALEHMGIEADTQKSQSRNLRFGYFGQVLFSKGVDLLVDAYRQLADEYQNVSLTIFGGTEGQPRYSAKLERSLGRVLRAEIKGRYEPQDIGSLLRDIDVVVVPSRWPEIGPLVLLEAFATRTPVIAARIGNMPELVDHNVNGLLFQPNSAQDLLAQMRRMLSEPELYVCLRSGIHLVRTQDNEMNELMEIYAEAVRNSRDRMRTEG